MTEDMLNSGAIPADGPQIGLQKIYIKDASFEAPTSPDIFRGEWKPKVTINLSTRSSDVGNDSVEVVLEISVEAKQEDSVAYLVELQQAGIFMLKGFEDDDRKRVLATYCPTQLYPYAREAVADLVSKGGFPQMQLQPVSFESMLAAAEAEREARKAAAAEEDSASV